MHRHRQALVQLVQSGIWGYGTHSQKWVVAAEFIDALTPEEARQFVAAFKAARLNKGDGDPLLTAARKYRGTYNLAAALLAGPQKK
jgi:hypothetical protein